MTDKKPLPADSVRLDAFFSHLTDWRAELLALRTILLDAGLTETFKWSSPVYTAHDGNVAIIWGFKDRAAIGFFKGVLMKDPEGLLEAPGENSRSSRMINFTGLDQIEAAAPALRAYIAEAVDIERQGLKVDLPKDDLDLCRKVNAALAEMISSGAWERSVELNLVPIGYAVDPALNPPAAQNCR